VAEHRIVLQWAEFSSIRQRYRLVSTDVFQQNDIDCYRPPNDKDRLVFVERQDRFKAPSNTRTVCFLNLWASNRRWALRQLKGGVTASIRFVVPSEEDESRCFTRYSENKSRYVDRILSAESDGVVCSRLPEENREMRVSQQIRICSTQTCIKTARNKHCTHRFNRHIER